MYEFTTVTVDEHGNKKTVTIYRTIPNPSAVVASANLLLKETGLSGETEKDDDPENLQELWEKLRVMREERRA